MFKKGFKALKKLGKKSSKKKDGGDGDNTSMASTTEDYGAQSKLREYYVMNIVYFLVS